MTPLSTPEASASLQAELEPIKRLTKDLAAATVTLSPREARYLVDIYYQMQDYRMSAAAQARSCAAESEPHAVLQWAYGQNEALEGQIKRALDKWTDSQPMGRWAKSVVGIGPVIAAGLLAHIDITKAPTVGHIWRFAGLDPTLVWGKGQKRPYNASLKTLCAFKLGESFVKTQNHKDSVYGKLFASKKRELEAANDALLYKESAANILLNKKIGKDTDAYKALIQGRLPQAQIHARARRWAVKIFLSHFHAESYRQHFGVEPPKPFAIAILGHAHVIEPGKVA